MLPPSLATSLHSVFLLWKPQFALLSGTGVIWHLECLLDGFLLFQSFYTTSSCHSFVREIIETHFLSVIKLILAHVLLVFSVLPFFCWNMLCAHIFCFPEGQPGNTVEPNLLPVGDNQFRWRHRFCCLWFCWKAELGWSRLQQIHPAEKFCWGRDNFWCCADQCIRWISCSNSACKELMVTWHPIVWWNLCKCFTGALAIFTNVPLDVNIPVCTGTLE